MYLPILPNDKMKSSSKPLTINQNPLNASEGLLGHISIISWFTQGQYSMLRLLLIHEYIAEKSNPPIG